METLSSMLPNTLCENLWAEGIHPIHQPALTQPLECDFLVIGGGLAGLSTALHLKKMQPDAQVALLDANTIGQGSSGLNSGMCGIRMGPAIEKHVKPLGQTMTADIYRYMKSAVKYAALLIDEHGIQCDLQGSTQWQVALTDKDAQSLVHRAKVYESLGFDVPLFGQQDVRKVLPDSSRIRNAIEFPAYLLNPYKLCLGLMQAALHMGVCLYENTKVEAHKRGRAIEFSANGYRLSYQKAILAVDGGIAQLSEHTASVFPIAVFAAVTRPLTRDERQRIGWLKEQGMYDIRPIFNFLRLTPEGRILIGGEYRYAHLGQINGQQRQECLNQVQQQLANFFPSLQHIEFEYQWHGVVGCTLDKWPVIGPLNNSSTCWHLGATNGCGLAISLISGREVAQAIMGQQPESHFPWQRSTLIGLGHPTVAQIAFPQYLSWLRWRSQLSNGEMKNVHV